MHVRIWGDCSSQMVLLAARHRAVHAVVSIARHVLEERKRVVGTILGRQMRFVVTRRASCLQWAQEKMPNGGNSMARQ